MLTDVEREQLLEYEMRMAYKMSPCKAWISQEMLNNSVDSLHAYIVEHGIPSTAMFERLNRRMMVGQEPGSDLTQRVMERYVRYGTGVDRATRLISFRAEVRARLNDSAFALASSPVAVRLEALSPGSLEHYIAQAVEDSPVFSNQEDVVNHFKDLLECALTRRVFGVIRFHHTLEEALQDEHEAQNQN